MFIVLMLVVVAVVFLPGVWAKYVLAKYSRERSEIPGTGGELAKHLIAACGLDDVKLERIEHGDHYDPIAKTVRLGAANFDQKSLTAITVAAHEVGHAIQDHIGYPPLQLRTKLVTFAQIAEKFGAVILLALPVITVISRAPVAGFLTFIIGAGILLIPVLVHLVTLPVEFDASFNRALPILDERYVPSEEMPAARRILRACALTYVAASLATLLNVWRWIAILRR